jgi:hypothetical protein
VRDLSCDDSLQVALERDEVDHPEEALLGRDLELTPIEATIERERSAAARAEDERRRRLDRACIRLEDELLGEREGPGELNPRSRRRGRAVWSR